MGVSEVACSLRSLLNPSRERLRRHFDGTRGAAPGDGSGQARTVRGAEAAEARVAGTVGRDRQAHVTLRPAPEHDGLAFDHRRYGVDADAIGFVHTRPAEVAGLKTEVER